MHLATVLFLVVAVFLIAGIEASQYRGKFEDPAHPGKCVVEGLVLEAGQTGRHPKECARVDCGEDIEAEISLCVADVLHPGYKFGKYTAPNAEYPACCNRDIIKE
nr:uncharacterized protein LOC108009553 [Drosophila suzukii]